MRKLTVRELQLRRQRRRLERLRARPKSEDYYEEVVRRLTDELKNR